MTKRTQIHRYVQLSKKKTGKKYYVCLVSTLKRGVYSSVVSVTVEKKENEQPIPGGTPVVEITADSHSVDANGALKFKCSASVEDGSKLSYQWYKTSTGKVSDGKYINGATESTYSAKESETGDYYYFCGVTTDNGGKAYSEVWKVTVNKAEVSETVEIVTSELDKGKVGESYKDYILIHLPSLRFLILKTPAFETGFLCFLRDFE